MTKCQSPKRIVKLSVYIIFVFSFLDVRNAYWRRSRRLLASGRRLPFSHKVQPHPRFPCPPPMKIVTRLKRTEKAANNIPIRYLSCFFIGIILTSATCGACIVIFVNLSLRYCFRNVVIVKNLLQRSLGLVIIYRQ